MIDLSFLRHLDRLSLLINKRVTSNYSGERVSSETGRGLVFKDYVIYSPGDDFRAIDWKVFARSDKLFSRRFEEERNLTVHAVVDYSASMGFSSSRGTPTKSEYAAMLGLGFAYMALKNNERFVLSTFADKLESYKPRRGRGQLVYLLDRLNQRKAAGASRFEESLGKFKALLSSKSFVIIISDFLYPPSEISTIVHRFRKHEVRLIQVLDPLEWDLNIEGDFKLRDSESNEELRTFVSPHLRKTYLAEMATHRAAIQKACDEVGAKFFAVPTNKPIFDTFYDVLQSDAHLHR